MITKHQIRAETKPTANERTTFWSFRAAGQGKGELQLYGIIESETWWGNEITPQTFKSELDALGDISVLDVFINSDGGDVFAGQAIHSMLKRHKAHVNVYIDGIAASIASVIAMAGDTVYMPRNAMLMIHSPWTVAMGNATDFRKMADDLDAARESMVAAYQDKSGMEREELIVLLEAETWLSAERAVELGFADEIEQTKQIAASVRNGSLTINGQAMDLTRYKNAPTLAEVIPAGNTVGSLEPPAPAFPVGGQIQVITTPHLEGHGTGTVREAVLTYAYGILFEGMEDMGIHHWYVESEIAGKSTIVEGIAEPEDKLKAKRTPLALYERMIQHNENRGI